MNIRIEGVSLENGRIPAIKLVRLVTNWGLKESKDYVEAQGLYFGGVVNGLVAHVVAHGKGQKINLPLLPVRPDIQYSIDAIKQKLAGETYIPRYDSIIDLDAPVNIPPLPLGSKGKPTISSLKKELEETKKALELVNKEYDSAKTERVCLMNRIDQEIRSNASFVQAQRNKDIDIEDLRNDLRSAKQEIQDLEDRLENSIRGPIQLIVGEHAVNITKDGILVR